MTTDAATGTDFSATLVALAARAAEARHTRTGERLAVPAAAGRPEHADGPSLPRPLTREAWRRELCAVASLANCGICWAVPGEPCTVAGTVYAPLAGYHAGRFDRAYRRGAITVSDLAVVTDGMMPGAIVWDGQDSHTLMQHREG